jgi:N-acetylglucosamine kinase-like BadF-type ATPase
MILIADSGSTKTDWSILQKEPKSFLTLGFNPFYRDVEFIVCEITKNKELIAISKSIEELYFYGAGCSSEERKATVKLALAEVFVNATIIVDHDLMACAHALYEGKPIIASILGTGTNTCYFDGVNVTQKKPSLGYVLGDEASGSYLGKKLVTKYLYGELSDGLKEAFYSKYQLSKDDLLENIYMKEGANTYLATFASFYREHSDHHQIKEILQKGFEHFFRTHILCFPNYKEVSVNFIGSIAHYYRAELTNVANSLDISIGKIIQKPMEGLLSYHQQN